LPPTRGSGSGVLDRRLGNTPKDRPPQYAADLATMRRLITRDVRSPWAGMRLLRLRSRYTEEYRLLRAKRDGEPYEQPEVTEKG
jgi:hypothetical protein